MESSGKSYGWRIQWCELDRQWLLIAPIGVVYRRFYDYQQAERCLDAMFNYED